jgi:guanylate kinase
LNTSPSGKLIVISGPSGVGKTTIVESVLAETPSSFSVSATTRAPRTGELDGVDYFYVDRRVFEEKVEHGEILEWAEYGGNLYGTLRSSVLPILESGRNVILDIENEGAKQIRASFPQAVLIFIAPPSVASLVERLARRGDTSSSDIALRLAAATRQIAEAPDVYDFVVENADLERAISDVLNILGAEGTEIAVQ